MWLRASGFLCAHPTPLTKDTTLHLSLDRASSYIHPIALCVVGHREIFPSSPSTAIKGSDPATPGPSLRPHLRLSCFRLHLRLHLQHRRRRRAAAPLPLCSSEVRLLILPHHVDDQRPSGPVFQHHEQWHSANSGRKLGLSTTPEQASPSAARCFLSALHLPPASADQLPPALQRVFPVARTQQRAEWQQNPAAPGPAACPELASPTCFSPTNAASAEQPTPLELPPDGADGPATPPATAHERPVHEPAAAELPAHGAAAGHEPAKHDFSAHELTAHELTADEPTGHQPAGNKPPAIHVPGQLDDVPAANSASARPPASCLDTATACSNSGPAVSADATAPPISADSCRAFRTESRAFSR